MTPARQPQYIITEDEIGEAMENAIDLRKMHDLIDKVLARTHTSAPAPMMNVDGCLCLGCRVEDKGQGEPEYCLPIRNSIQNAAKAERENLWKRLEKACVEYHNAPVVHFSSIEDIFKSLRVQQQGGVSE